MIPSLRLASSNKRQSRAFDHGRGLPKNISIEELTFPSAVELNLLGQAKRQSRALRKTWSSSTSEATRSRADPGEPGTEGYGEGTEGYP